MAGFGRHRLQMGSGRDKTNCAFKDRCRKKGYDTWQRVVTIKSLRILTETNQDLPGWLNRSLTEGSEFNNCKIFIIMVIMRKCQIVKGGMTVERLQGLGTAGRLGKHP